MTEDELVAEIALHLERGEPMPPQIAEDPRTEPLLAELVEVTEALGAHQAEAAPEGNWEAKIWAGIAQEEASARPQRPKWLVWLLGPALAAAAALAVVMLSKDTQTHGPRGLSLEVIADAQGVRGDHAKVGDRLRLNVSLGDASRADLRVYRGESELVYRCHRDQRGDNCTISDTAITATVGFPATGEYRALVIYDGDLPLSGGLDADVAAARAKSLKITLSDAIEVF
ncbi:MAG: hypothetical protein ACE366_14835 [Bradymonadia bacterium]